MNIRFSKVTARTVSASLMLLELGTTFFKRILHLICKVTCFKASLKDKDKTEDNGMHS